MPLFLIEFPTTGGGLRQRGPDYQAARSARRAYRQGLAGRIILAGPKFENPESDAVASLMILVAESRDQAAKIAADDPYYLMGELGAFTVNQIAITDFDGTFQAPQ